MWSNSAQCGPMWSNSAQCGLIRPNVIHFLQIEQKSDWFKPDWVELDQIGLNWNEFKKIELISTDQVTQPQVSNALSPTSTLK